MNDQAKETARGELQEFWRAKGAYNGFLSNDEAVDRFLERNHVVRLPEQGEMVVTEEQVTPAYPGPIYTAVFVNGKEFSRNLDPFSYQMSIEEGQRQVKIAERELGRHVELLEKRRAVLSFLTDKQAKETQYEAERQERRDKIAQEYKSMTYDRTMPSTRALIDRIIDAEDRVDAVKS